jgi:beta-lactam-binding protein with PASTA domain
MEEAPRPDTPQDGTPAEAGPEEEAVDVQRSNGPFIALVVLVLVILAGFYIHRYGVPGIHHTPKRHPFRTVVPDVVGDTYSVAFGRITAAGLCTRHVSYEPNAGTPRNEVATQNPAGGKILPNLTGIDIVISSGSSGVAAPSNMSAMEPTCPH